MQLANKVNKDVVSAAKWEISKQEEGILTAEQIEELSLNRLALADGMSDLPEISDE